MAHPTIRTCELCLRRASLILRAQYGPKLSHVCGSDSANATSGSPPAGFLALSPPKLRWRLFDPRHGQSGTLLCGGLVRRSELTRYCMNSFGTAMLYRTRHDVIEGRTGDRLKNLKWKENAPIVSFEFLSAQKSTIPVATISEITSTC